MAFYAILQGRHILEFIGNKGYQLV